LSNFDFVFAENGLVAFKSGRLIGSHSIVEHLGEAKVQRLLNFSLWYMSQLELPFKRGHFVDFRTGVINLCPVGRSCSQVPMTFLFTGFTEIFVLRFQSAHMYVSADETCRMPLLMPGARQLYKYVAGTPF
jgi:hypothetical protein